MLAVKLLTRRDVVRLGAISLFAFEVDGAEQFLTPREARAQGARLSVLTDAERITLEALGETLLPGAAAAGLAPFVDAQLRAAPQDSLLLLRYLDVPPPYASFYRAGLASLDRVSLAAHGQSFAALTPARRREVVGGLRTANPAGWQGAPAPVFYLALRGDALDVVYGTPQGAALLGVPYMSHVSPPRPW